MNVSLENFRNRIFNPTDEGRKSASYSLAVFSANIKRFLPSINASDYEEFYKEVIYYQKVSGIEQADTDYLRKSKIIDNTFIDVSSGVVKQHTIFATFHLGSYRLMNCYLYELGYKVVLIIDDSVFNKQQEEMLRVCREVLDGKASSDMIILNIKDRKSIFRLKQLVEEGYVMSVYLDGNSAMMEKNQDFTKSYIPIDFLKNKIFVKNGVGKLATLLQAQIVPVVSFRETAQSNTLEFHKEIRMEDFETKEEFAVQAIELAYQKLEAKLIHYPQQWECWLYIHKWFMRDASAAYVSSEKIEGFFNKERYTTFSLGKANFLFDLIDYQSYPIEEELYTALNKNSFDTIGLDLMQELLSKNIII